MSTLFPYVAPASKPEHKTSLQLSIERQKAEAKKAKKTKTTKES
jgi:hypothetical protein